MGRGKGPFILIAMQKKQLLIIATCLCILFSLIRLTNLEVEHIKQIERTSAVRFRFLIGVHALLLMAMIAFYFLDDFYNSIGIAFLFFTIVAISFAICQAMVKGHPGRHEDEDYLIFRDKFKKQREKSYLSVYYLTYIYSIIGSIMLGIFLLVRYLLVRWYQRLLLRELSTAVTVVPISEDLKGKECTICIHELCSDENKEDLYALNVCKHIFHSECLSEWVHYSRTCPLCRANIFPERRASHQQS